MGIVKKYYKIGLWIFVIGILCFTPSNEFKEVKINIPHLDKIVHFVMFYILGLLIESVFLNSKKNRNYFIIGGLLYGCLIEVFQHYLIATRSGDIIDFLFDALGLVLGIVSLKYYPVFFKKLLK